MYRLMIVDDEPIIANSIYQYFLEESGLELELFRAYSALEALEIAEKTRIDIVITDISMPVMNGIELQERLYDKWANCKFIYLTSHDNVQFAQKAIRNGAFVDFVLKNEEDSVILTAVQKAIEDIKHTNKNEELLFLAKQQMREALPFLHKEYLSTLLDGKEEALSSMAEHFLQFNIPLNVKAPLNMFFGRIDDYGGKFSSTDRKLLHFALENIVQEQIGRTVALTSISCDAYTIVWLFQPFESDPDNVSTIRYVYDTLEIVQSICKQLLEVTLSLVMTNSPFSWDQLSSRFSRLKYVMNRYFGISQELLMIDHSAESDLNLANETMTSQIRAKIKKIEILERLLESGQRDEFFELYNEIKHVPDFLPISYQIELLSALQTCLISCVNRSPQLLNLVKLEDYFMISGTLNWLESIKKFASLATKIFDWSVDDQQNQVSALIVSVTSYVEGHLTEDLSLTRIAEMVYHNPTYFSKLFKRTTGVGYNEFVTERRLNKAAALLTTTNMKVNEVSIQVGYEAPTYFMRVFKKHFILTPQEYRESKLSQLI